MVEMASNFNLGVNEDDIEEHPKVITTEFTNKQLFKLEQELIVEEEARENETAGREEKEDLHENSQ